MVLRAGAALSPDELIAWSRSRLAGYKRPREIEFVTELPKTNVGKILRRELKVFTWVILIAICIGARGPWPNERFWQGSPKPAFAWDSICAPCS